MFFSRILRFCLSWLLYDALYHTNDPSCWRSLWGWYHLTSWRHGRAVWRVFFSVRRPPRRQLLKEALAIGLVAAPLSPYLVRWSEKYPLISFLVGPTWTTHHSWLPSWNVLQHCGNCHWQTQAVQDVEQGGQHRYTTGLMQNTQLNGHVEHQGGDAKEPQLHFEVLNCLGARLGAPPWGPPPLALGCCPRSQMNPYPAQSAVVYTSFNPQTQIDLPHHPPTAKKI